MSLHFEPEPPPPPAAPNVPNAALAHDANDHAVRSRAARASVDAIGRRMRTELSHPVHRKIVGALASRKLVFFALAVPVFPVVLVWEWVISQPVYEILLPLAPVLPFVVAAARRGAPSSSTSRP